VNSSPTIEDIVEGKAGILTCTVVARRRLCAEIYEADPFLHLGGDFLMGDTPLWAEIATVSKVRFLDDSTATKNVLVESMSRSLDRVKQLEFLISCSEMCLYLCKKHGFPKALTRRHERMVRRMSLKLAYLSNRKELAEKFRSQSEQFDAGDWFWYLGSKLLRR
jgi:hypothetical protein